LSKWTTYITMPKQMTKHIREYCALDDISKQLLKLQWSDWIFLLGPTIVFWR
jgi:hypothetical protein